VVNAVLLSPLPYERSEDLVRIWSSWTQFPRGGVSEPEYYDYRASDSIESIGAFIFPHDATLAASLPWKPSATSEGHVLFIGR
jgi:hypothetical protein